MKSNLSYEKARLKELVWSLLQIYQPNCFLCGKPFIKSDVLPSRGTDNLTEHHVDHNHYNNAPENRRMVHRSCHKSHHSGENINFWRQFNDMS